MKLIRLFSSSLFIVFLVSIAVVLSYGFFVWLVLAFMNQFGIFGGVIVLSAIIAFVYVITSLLLSKR